MKTLTNNTIIDDLLRSDYSEQNLTYIFQECVIDFLRYPKKYDYSEAQKQTLIGKLPNDYFELFTIWANKLGFKSSTAKITQESFVEYVSTFPYPFFRVMTANKSVDKFVYVVDYKNPTLDNITNRQFTKLVFVGENMGFRNKSAAIAEFRKTKKAGRFISDRKLGIIYSKPEVVKMSQLGFEHMPSVFDFTV